MHTIYLTPSLYSHFLNALFLFLALVIFVIYFPQVKKISSYELVTISLLSSIAIGIHGISHLGLEKIYNFNPYHMFYTSIKI